MRIKDLKGKMVYLFAVGLSIFLLFFFVTGTWIGYDVKSQCRDAQREYGGDCVNSLITLLNDQNKDFRQRNNAIWALGQLGDKRALPILQSYYTGVIPDKEPLGQTISQYELQKAINLADGGTNIAAFIWRGFVNQN
ncbi:HEAT repeat domain-containing protein [Patescibacteria group bacterium]|nr:HEAT repeat domain-containing protein [Patescibacteria group bacterium]MCL5409446.1 HEAT repeat domain-containing protein [Patescibacteria group bacterium]